MHQASRKTHFCWLYCRETAADTRHCCEYKCVGSHDSCHALPGGKVESKAGGSAWEDSDGALGRKALASAAAVLAGLAF